MYIHWLDWLGYISAAIILVSMIGSSLKFKLLNLVGVVMLGIYGYLLGSRPVAGLYIGLSLIQSYKIIKVYGLDVLDKIKNTGKKNEIE